MAWTQTHVTGCRVASIRRTPWIPLHDKEIVGIRDGPKFDADDTSICNPERRIHKGVIDYGGDTNG